MKKITAILMALILVLAMAACGNDIPTKAPADVDKTEAPAPSSSEKPAESTPAATEPEVTEAAATTPEAAQPTEPAPVETKVPETAPSEQAPETAPPETAPAETVPPETTPAETAPPETQAPETTPVETTPEETAPLETKPEETAPVETVPPETEVDSSKAAYYETFVSNGDIKPYGDAMRATEILNGEILLSMAYGSGALVLETEAGKMELYQQDNQLYAHIYLKPYDGNEGEDNWKVCEIPEEEDPFGNFAMMGSPEEMFEGMDDDTVKLEYQYSFTENGTEYECLLMKNMLDPEDPESAAEGYMIVRADTHEVVCLEIELNDSENTQGEKVEFLDSSEFAMPGNVEAESADYQMLMMDLFAAMMTLMGDLF